MLTKLLNERGQIRLLVFATFLLICHFIAVVYNASFINVGSEQLLIISLILLLINGAHVLFLAIFNRYLRHPLVRYCLLGITFELILVGIFIFGVVYGNVDKFSFKNFFEFFKLVHKQPNTWYFLILPSLTTSAAAIIIELKEGRYYAIEKPKNKISTLLDDL
jgi:glucan phosphoethanolaminetransferase (alkaline phosphatase superfamily)